METSARSITNPPRDQFIGFRIDGMFRCRVRRIEHATQRASVIVQKA